MALTWRDRLRITYHRTTRREYWPTTVQYLILAPYLIYLAIRYGPTTFTCCNPGITGGGGMIGESKKAILDTLMASGRALPGVLIAAGPSPADRAHTALDAIAQRPELGGYPIILKPDAGQRGFAVKIARDAADIERYFAAVTSPVLVQRYHPGPHECGIAWIRKAGYPHAPRGAPLGSIFSITRKDFPVITGDGRRTLERLILDHPRYHCQAAVFLQRFADQRARVLAVGEILRLTQSGNHCQGTLFRDGADLITPDLERGIDEIARSIDPPLDAGRFDLRYESDDALRRGEGFAIVELNGTAGESTNIYDPEKSILWAYRVLAAQWRRLYELGAERRREGVKPLGVLGLVREVRRHYKERTGSALAD
jgi:hypothetical protein